MQNFIAAVKAVDTMELVWNKETKTYDEMPCNPTVIDRGDGDIVVSAEDGRGFAEYYGPNGYPYIHHMLEKVAEEYGYYWEWETAGAIIAYKL